MVDELILYHGTNVYFEQVDLNHSKDKRDFGRGFYTTTQIEQAQNWAENMNIRYGGDGNYVMKYKIHFDSELFIKVFNGLNREWLTMIKDNRLIGGIQHNYDIVIGPVADDNTIRTVALYVADIYTEEMALEQLKSFDASDQVSIHTQRALDCLEFIGRA
jgi:adenine specific DNA methylase Mod